MGCGSSTATGRETSATSSRKVPPSAENFFPQPNSAPPNNPGDISEKQSPAPSATPSKTHKETPATTAPENHVLASGAAESAVANSAVSKKKDSYTPPPAIGYENITPSPQAATDGEVSVQTGPTSQATSAIGASSSGKPASNPIAETSAGTGSSNSPPSSPVSKTASTSKGDKKPYVPPAPIHLSGTFSSSATATTEADRSQTVVTGISSVTRASGVTPTTNNRSSDKVRPKEEVGGEDDEAESLEGSLDTSEVLFSGDDANAGGGGLSDDLKELGGFEASKELLEDVEPSTDKKNIVVSDTRKASHPNPRQSSMTSLLSITETPQPSSASGMRFDELYRLKGVLGTGAFSTVREGFHRSNAEVSFAVKCVNRKKLSEEDEAALLDEVGILKELRHLHIIRLYDFFEEPSTYYLVLERMRGGELFDRIVAKAYYNEKEARDTCKIVLEAVRYCHENHVAHRDLKPENLLLLSEHDDSIVKIADFGFAKKVFEKNSLTTQCGTPGYVAPEILEGTPYDERADMWSVGVILYILLGGYPPFIESTQRDLFRKIRKGEYEFHEEYWGTVSTEAKELISSLLSVDVNARLTADDALVNPWITGDDAKLAKRDLGANLQKFRNFNAKRKFRAAVSTIIAINKLNSLKEEFFTTLKETTVQIVAEKSLSQKNIHVDS